MRNGGMPRWELWLDAFAVGFLFGFGLLLALLPVIALVVTR